MYHIIPSKMICSKCKSDKIVAPCNEPGINFRCLDCGHEQKYKPKPYTSVGTDTAYWGLGDDVKIIEI